MRLTWRRLYQQFGPTDKADKKTIDNFRTQVLRELAKLKDAWPQLDYRTPPGCLEARLTWRFAGAMLAQTGVILAAVIGAAIAILRMLG